jgi:hypothetical protein
MNSLDGLVVVVVEGWHDKQDEIHKETKLHHSLSANELVIDQEGSQVVAAKGDGDVDEVPQPTGHDVSRLGD